MICPDFMSRIKPLHALCTLLLGFFLCLPGLAAAEAAAEAGAQVEAAAPVVPDLTIVSQQSGTSHAFSLELAVTIEQWAQGLMFREHIAPDHGMLFVATERPRRTSFWMRNTLIELDMIFITRDWRIGHIHHRAQPLDETPIPSRVVVVGVLEIAGGRAEELGLQIGDKLEVAPALVAKFPPCRIACTMPTDGE